MAFDDDGPLGAIAQEWGVSPELLEDTQWELESNDNNDGFTVSYFVRFSEDTDRELLTRLGVTPGEFYREVSINAFDEPEPDEPDERRATGSGTGATFAGTSFVGDSFALRDGVREAPDSSDDHDDDDGIYSLEDPLPDISNFIDDDFEFPEPAERANDRRRAYFIDEERFTPSQFRRLSKRRKVEAMVQWFHENYEDPAVRLPHESAEGGYQWIWGGPYDAREQISDQFSDVSDEAAIEEAATEVTSDGLFDWAPKARREDYRQDEDLNLPGDDVDYNQPDVREDYTTPTLSRRDPTPVGEAVPIDVGSTNFADSNFSNFTFAPSDQRSTADFLGTDDGSSIVDENGNRLVIGEGAGSVEALRREMLARMDDLEAVFRQNLNVSPNRGAQPPTRVA